MTEPVVPTQPPLAQITLTGDEVMSLLCSHLKLDRDRGCLALGKLLRSWASPSDERTREEQILERRKLEGSILSILETEPETPEPEPDGPTPATSIDRGQVQLWEKKVGCLMACHPLISTTDVEDKAFLHKLQSITLKLLGSNEVTPVQLAAGGVLGFISKYLGVSVYESSRDRLFDLITTNLAPSSLVSSPVDELQSVEQGFDVHIPATLIRDKVVRESLGWHRVEPSLKCLQVMVESLDIDFVHCIEPRLIKIVLFSCLAHPIRYVRETGFQLLASIIVAAQADVFQYAHPISYHLGHGMSDNWNQVRLAASIATRKFFLTFSENKEEFYPILLPKLCLNRYYKAEGIRAYNQETWKLVAGIEGRSLVAKYIDDITNAYLESTAAENVAERESACSCISELAAKIECHSVRPFITPLLEALIKCSKDESWSVRDAASLACGTLIQHYPEESRAHLTELYPILFKNLEDPAPLLRQAAASALASISSAYGVEALSFILDKVVPGLRAVEKMSDPATPAAILAAAETLGASESSCVQHDPRCEFAVPGKVQLTSAALFNAMNPATVPLVSCLSCRKSKIPQPWHLSDGCLFLVGALSEMTACSSELPALVPLMIRAVQVRSYVEHYTLNETLCKVIPLVANGIGKKPFKEFLNALFEPIFYTLESANPETSAAGRTCLRFLSEFLGPNIFRSRVEMYDPRFVHLVQDIA